MIYSVMSMRKKNKKLRDPIFSKDNRDTRDIHLEGFPEI
jgi:hypothetical protein